MTRRTPQYVRCELCNHVWIAVWMPMVMGDAAKVLECTRCPMCASDSSYHKAHNDPQAVKAAAAQCVDPPIPVAFDLRTDSHMAYELRLLLGKVQLSQPILANEHKRAIAFLGALPRQIECAVSHVLAQSRTESAL